MAAYLRDVVPLKFDTESFKWANKIENEINRIAEEKGAKFELVNLQLQVLNHVETLFRPYSDSIFYNGLSLEPQFEVIEKNKIFYGVVWGCLNKARKKIKESSLQGFLLRRQGFAIGTRKSMEQYFGSGRRKVFYDRYVGEIIVLHPQLIPNAARDGLQYSTLRTNFFAALTTVTKKYLETAQSFQEFSKGDELISQTKDLLRTINAENLEYTENESILLDNIVEVRNATETLKKRLARKNTIREENKPYAKELIDLGKKLESSFRSRLKVLSEKKKRNISKSGSSSTLSIGVALNEIPAEPMTEERFESLIDLLDYLDYPVPERLKPVIDLIDDLFIQTGSKSDYNNSLQELKSELEDLND